jgi:hypothetical protein
VRANAGEGSGSRLDRRSTVRVPTTPSLLVRTNLLTVTASVLAYAPTHLEST